MTTNSLRETAVTPRTLVLIGIGLAVVLLGGVLIATPLLAWNRYAQVSPPPEFRRLAEVDLSAQAWEGEAAARFSLAEAADVALYFSVRQIDSAYFDLSLHGPDGYQVLIMHSESYRTDEVEAGWQRGFSLPAGDYELVLTAVQSPGMLTIYSNQKN